MLRGLVLRVACGPAADGGAAAARAQLSEPAAADRRGIGFGWLQNAWLLHARLKLKILTRGLQPYSCGYREPPSENERKKRHMSRGGLP